MKIPTGLTGLSIGSVIGSLLRDVAPQVMRDEVVKARNRNRRLRRVMRGVSYTTKGPGIVPPGRYTRLDPKTGERVIRDSCKLRPKELLGSYDFEYTLLRIVNQGEFARAVKLYDKHREMFPRVKLTRSNAMIRSCRQQLSS